jgi:hypothetical protein
MSKDLIKHSGSNEPNLKYGLITKDNKSSQHKCTTPGFFKRIFLRLFKIKIGHGSLYRCECGLVYYFDTDYHRIGSWVKDYNESWERAGGQLETKTRVKLLEEKNIAEEFEREEQARQELAEEARRKWDKKLKAKILPKGSQPLSELIDETIEKANLKSIL